MTGREEVEAAGALTVGSLFSGIGGLELGLERAGMRHVWYSEVDPYCIRVHEKHWPDVPNLGDVTQVDWSTVERVDLICGGYPCQPFSLAGARRGHDDPRHLWPYFADALRVLRPRYALLENVPGHLSLGFGHVLGDLAELGYDCEWDCIPAAAVGAPHLRYRIFVVAYANRESESERTVDALEGRGELVPDTDRDGLRQPVSERRGSGSPVAIVDGTAGPVADPYREGSQGWVFGSRRARQQLARTRSESHARYWSPEPDVGRVAHGVPNRVDRLRALGNAVVPQVAEWIGARLLESISAGALGEETDAS